MRRVKDSPPKKVRIQYKYAARVTAVACCARREIAARAAMDLSAIASKSQDKALQDALGVSAKAVGARGS